MISLVNKSNYKVLHQILHQISACMQVLLQLSMCCAVLLSKWTTYLYSFTLAEDWRVRVKMVSPPVIGPARNISHQVHRPSQSQSDHNVCQPDGACESQAEVIVSLLHGWNKDLQK